MALCFLVEYHYPEPDRTGSDKARLLARSLLPFNKAKALSPRRCRMLMLMLLLLLLVGGIIGLDGISRV
jgi:hypothetical protein